MLYTFSKIMQYINLYKQMRLILIYDLPVTDEENRKIYSRFHRNIIRLGFYMLQYSVYSKVIQNDTSMKQYLYKLERVVPKVGNIVVLKITEKQYQDMIYLRGDKNKFDILVGGKELVIFGGDYCDNAESEN